MQETSGKDLVLVTVIGKINYYEKRLQISKNSNVPLFCPISYCAPVFAKFEKRLEKDKRDLIRHIDTHQMKLDTKIAYLEKKTKEQLFGLNQSMKEAFAAERGECLDRMERRALRERIAIERQQVNIILKYCRP